VCASEGACSLLDFLLVFTSHLFSASVNKSLLSSNFASDFWFSLFLLSRSYNHDLRRLADHIPNFSAFYRLLSLVVAIFSLGHNSTRNVVCSIELPAISGDGHATVRNVLVTSSLEPLYSSINERDHLGEASPTSYFLDNVVQYKSKPSFCPCEAIHVPLSQVYPHVRVIIYHVLNPAVRADNDDNCTSGTS
jgi:hypothetical protein